MGIPQHPGLQGQASKLAHVASFFPPPGDVRYNEAMGYPMVQQWRVRSNLYRVKLSTITLSAGEDCAGRWGLAPFSTVPKDRGVRAVRALGQAGSDIFSAVGSAQYWGCRGTEEGTVHSGKSGGFLEEGVSV